MPVRSRDDDGNGAKQRSFYEKYKVVLTTIMAISGGSMAGIGVKFYNTSEVNQAPARVERLEDRVTNYIDSHSREEALNKQLLLNSLANIKEDINELKEDNKELQNKIDDLTRIVRNGGGN